MARVDLNHSAIRKLADSAAVEKDVAAVGQHVANRVNEKDAQVLTPGEKGGIGSFKVLGIEHGDDGAYAVLGYDEDHPYMWIHNWGSEHEKPRPTVLPALFTPQRGTT